MERELYDVLSTALQQPLPLELASVVARRMTRTTIKKGEILLRPGEVNRKLHFIQRGLLRAYWLIDGVEKTGWIKAESEFVVSISSFWSQRPSVQFIHAIEDTEVFYISYEDFWHICRTHLEFSLIGLVSIIPVLEEWDERVYMLEVLDVTKRFDWFMERHSNLITRVPGVPGKYIASYLGMTPETFSKVKAKYFRLSERQETNTSAHS